VPVARIEDEVITMRQLTQALAGVHGTRAVEGASAGKKDFEPVLDRLVNARLLVVEAREMGIDELPEVQESVKAYRATAGQEMLKERVIEEVKADPAEVERAYKDAVREWKVRSVLLYQEASAKAFQADLKAGKGFEAVAQQAAKDKKGEYTPTAEFLPRAKMLPQLLAGLTGLEAGKVSPPIKIAEGWAILEVLEVRYPEDAAQRAQVANVVLTQARTKALQARYEGLIKKYAKIDKKLLNAVSFEVPGKGIQGLLNDRRVLATFPKGEQPITVGDLAKALDQGFFHGAERAVKEKKVNRQKLEVFDGMLARKVIPLEVKALNLEALPEFDERVADFERNLLFTRFLEKVIVPEIKVGEPEVRKYWEAHKADYMYPAFWRVESLAFKDVKSAQAAIDKLRGGTDFKWLNANADGQLKPGERTVSLGGVLAASALPKDVADALAGAGKGDYRLYASPNSQYYAIHVIDYTAPAAQPFEEVQETAQQRLYLESMGKAIETWGGKLRKLRKVDVFITRIGG
jgi:hypothetical protein